MLPVLRQACSSLPCCSPQQHPTAIVSLSVPVVPGSASAVSVTEEKIRNASIYFLRPDRPLWASEMVSKQVANAFAA